jgi:hypothetical protein
MTNRLTIGQRTSPSSSPRNSPRQDAPPPRPETPTPPNLALQTRTLNRQSVVRRMPLTQRDPSSPEKTGTRFEAGSGDAVRRLPSNGFSSTRTSRTLQKRLEHKEPTVTGEPVRSVPVISSAKARKYRERLAERSTQLAAAKAARVPTEVLTEEDIVSLIAEADLYASDEEGRYRVKEASGMLRGKNGATQALSAYLQPCAERHLNSQALTAIDTSLAWPMATDNATKLDTKTLDAWPDQLGALCTTIDNYALLAARFIRSMPDGMTRIRAGTLPFVEARFPDQTENNSRRLDGALIWCPLLAPFNDIQAAAMEVAPHLKAYISFCNMVLQKLVFGLEVEGLDEMPEALQAAIGRARRSIAMEMQDKLHPGTH